jgi:hypothetical protein
VNGVASINHLLSGCESTEPLCDVNSGPESQILALGHQYLLTTALRTSEQSSSQGSPEIGLGGLAAKRAFRDSYRVLARRLSQRCRFRGKANGIPG